MTTGEATFGANQAAEMEQAQQMAGILINNLIEEEDIARQRSPLDSNIYAELLRRSNASFLLDLELDNLANASIQKNTTINNLVMTNTALSKAIQYIQCTLVTMMTNQTPTPGTPAPPGQPTGERTRPPDWATVKPPWDKTGYCWCHGFKVKLGHTSSTCTSCKASHQPGATRTNTMGGSIINAGWPAAPPTLST